MRRITLTLALVAACACLPGCVFAVGAHHDDPTDERLDRLERRVRTVERELGLPAPDQAESPQ